jgi:hypothetical protein
LSYDARGRGISIHELSTRISAHEGLCRAALSSRGSSCLLDLLLIR